MAGQVVRPAALQQVLLPHAVAAAWCDCCCCRPLPTHAGVFACILAGAGVYFTTMITQGVSYRNGNHWRACAAPVSRELVRQALAGQCQA